MRIIEVMMLIGQPNEQSRDVRGESKRHEKPSSRRSAPTHAKADGRRPFASPALQ